jgi:ribonuclease HI
MKYYAIKKGNNPGIYTNWNEAKKQIKGFPGALYKSFTNVEDAENFMNQEALTYSEELLESLDSFAFVDGSFNVDTGNYGSGWFIYSKINDHTVFQFGMTCGKEDDELATMRNVAGEVVAASEAINAAIENKLKKIAIFYDYQGVESWANGSWNCNNELTKSYHNYINKCKKKIDITFVKVNSHTNVLMNDYVDLLAKSVCGVKFEEDFNEIDRKVKQKLGVDDIC